MLLGLRNDMDVFSFCLQLAHLAVFDEPEMSLSESDWKTLQLKDDHYIRARSGRARLSRLSLLIPHTNNTHGNHYITNRGQDERSEQS